MQCNATQVPVEDLHTASQLLARALNIRQKYMRLSYQEFPTNVERCPVFLFSFQ